MRCLGVHHLETGLSPAALKRVLKGRRNMLEAGEADWAMGEAFAFGSLLQEDIHVRVSGTSVIPT